MAYSKVTRLDYRRPQSSSKSSLCSNTVMVVFIGLCLAVAWAMTSSRKFPVIISSSDNSSDEISSQFSDISTESSMEDSAQEGNFNTEPKVVFDDSNSDSTDLGDGTSEKTVQKTQDGEENQNDTENEEKSDTETTKIEQSVTEESEEEDQGSKSKPNSNSKAEVFPDGAQSEILKETETQNGAFSTQAAESKNEKEMQILNLSKDKMKSYKWKLCNVQAGPDYIPCLDNEKAIKKLRSTKHYEHRERHCPEVGPTCLVPLPEGYKRSIEWPQSRDKIWYNNVPNTKLAEVKGHQNWVKVSGEYLTFPGGGTQFKHGALHYIDFIQKSFPDIAWGKRTRVVLDVGCGVASFGGYLFDRDVLTMSFAPKDEHEAQVQFALERGIPAISAVMGTKILPFPGRVFDVIHCARCRVPWHIEGGMLLLELNRLLRPGGYFVWSATPVYQKLPEDVEIWNAMSALTKSMCWKLVNKTRDKINEVGMAVYRKPMDNKCYEKRAENKPPLCSATERSDAAWNISLQACMHKLPEESTERGSQWPSQWPLRLEKAPYWLESQVGVYGKQAKKDFEADYELWKRVAKNSYLNGMGIDWSKVRNVMDMRSLYGGFAAALKEMKVWVMNVVPIDSPDTLPIIYERGLFGMYHDWCESFSTYPRSYDLLHADHLFSKLKKRCNLLSIIAEVDRILRPGGNFIVRDKVDMVNEIEEIVKSLHWEIRMIYSKDTEGVLCVQKTMWRPK
ncbi:S-adenosyl-L-methionine-dependent methyltransferases superfamily protein [Rhynchospora pubera]|uniref:Methyltransferase n=1 Tax=Rhynchospora pubera TaxID=906938 RepID=A0AAV8H150_9POAL|nr:S-adenosyl-L-methionine-dependent methyltransferases superfamily protein [Rhynchospora pubera]